MDLNQIKLPASVIADLYYSSLIVMDKVPVIFQPEVVVNVEKDQPDIGWKWLGDNSKNILLIVHYTDVVHLPDHELSFLSGMLGACNLTLGDVAIVNLHNHPEKSYKELIVHFKSKIVFLFGVEPKAFHLPISFPHFQIQPFGNCSFLFSPALKELEYDKMLKSKLWVCLRRIFNI